jgi:hypothetical protein
MTKARDMADLMGTDGLVQSHKLHQFTINGRAIGLGDTADIGLTWIEKDESFNAEANKAYAVDSSAMALNATLPSNPSLGDEIRFLDATGSFGTYYFTVMRNNKKIQGVADNLVVSTSRAGFSLIFYNNTDGWVLKEK